MKKSVLERIHDIRQRFTRKFCPLVNGDHCIYCVEIYVKNKK